MGVTPMPSAPGDPSARQPCPGRLCTPAFLALRRAWQRDEVSEMTRRKNEGFLPTG